MANCPQQLSKLTPLLLVLVEVMCFKKPKLKRTFLTCKYSFDQSIIK